MSEIDDAALGEAIVLMSKAAQDAELSYDLHGALYLSRGGGLMMAVPNALARGAFDALHVPGAKLPPGPDGGQFNAHVVVMRPAEIEKIGGPAKIKERGKQVRYSLGPVRTVRPTSWPAIRRIWFIEIRSPELERIRKSYGLSSLPRDGKHPFHCVFAVHLSETRLTTPDVQEFRIHQVAERLQATRRASEIRKHASEEARALLRTSVKQADSDVPTRSLLDHYMMSTRDVIDLLNKAKELSDKRQFRHKATIIRALLQRVPSQFVVDSGRGRYVGLTHRSGFRIHAPAKIVPPTIARVSTGPAVTVAPGLGRRRSLGIRVTTGD